jgi:flavodoxin
MKHIVIYYSHSGITKIVATKIAQILNCEIEEIIDYKNHQGIIGWFVAGKDAVMKNLTKINTIKKDISLYDNIIIGTPVWAGNVTPAIRTFVTNYYPKFKKVTFFCTMGGAGSNRVFKELELLCHQKPVLTLAIKRAEVFSGEYVNKINSCFNQEIFVSAGKNSAKK